jgi:tRNA pseudouridine38-40 synthase
VRWRVRFAYDGAGFHGWARQPKLRTVEGEILHGIVPRGIASSIPSARVEAASRTDRGVSARANVLGITSDRDPRSLLRALNGIAPDLYFTALAPAPEGSRVRGAIRRTYRYYEGSLGRNLDGYRAAAATFAGRMDVRSFGRWIPGEVPTWREVEHVTVAESSDGWVVEVAAPSFVWGMVRKIVGACREVEAGKLPLRRLQRAVGGTERLTLPMAEAAPLVLWEVEYPEPWVYFWTGPNRHQVAALALQRNARRAQQSVGAAVSERLR